MACHRQCGGPGLRFVGIALLDIFHGNGVVVEQQPIARLRIETRFRNGSGDGFDIGAVHAIGFDERHRSVPRQALHSRSNPILDAQRGRMGALRIQGKRHHLRTTLLAKGGKRLLDGVLAIALPDLDRCIHAVFLQALLQQRAKLGMLHIERRPGFRPDLRVFLPGLHRTRWKDAQMQDQPPRHLGHGPYALVHQKPAQIPAHIARFGAFRRARVREQHADALGLTCRHNNRLQTKPAKTRRRPLQPPDATCLQANTLPNAIKRRNPPNDVPVPWGAERRPAARTLPYPPRYDRGCETQACRAPPQDHRSGCRRRTGPRPSWAA